MSAEISSCGRYRYTLRREIPQPLRWVRPCLFIMLNPSTADATEDDRTIRRCLGFAKSWGCTSLTVVNLFAFRATKPRDLWRAEDPVGPENDRHIAEQIIAHRLGAVIAAWGVQAARHPLRALDVIQRFGPFECLRRTKSGAPEHPLYIPATKERETYP